MITRAAILMPEKLWVGEENERHHHLIHKIYCAGYRAAKGIQGFVNHTGKFLTREEAAKEALECGQVIVGHANIKHEFNGRELFSEDLW
jgi:hypothetical protein